MTITFLPWVILAALGIWTVILFYRPQRLEKSIYGVVSGLSVLAHSRIAAIPGVEVSGTPAKSRLPGRIASLRLQIAAKGTHFADMWIFWDTAPGEPHIEIEAWTRNRHSTLNETYKLEEFWTALGRIEEIVKAAVSPPVIE
jgi:hypothetical protein